MSDVIIVGAGITGLALARRLAREQRDALVLEASDRPGGHVRTHRTGGLMLELGPQSLRPQPNTLALIDDLQLRDRVVPSAPAAKKRFVLWEGKLRPVPAALLDRTFVRRRDLARLLIEPFIPRKEAIEGESVQDFIARRFGPVVADRLMDPMVAGIYAGDPHRIEIAATFPDLVRWEGRGSVLLGAIASGVRTRRPAWAPATTFTMKNGLSSLVDTVAGSLPQGSVHLDSAVERIERSGSGFRVFAPGGPYEAARVAVTAMPAHASTLVADLDPELAAMPSAMVAAVHLVFKASEAASPDGFGWLAPSSQRTDVLGTLWVSSSFPTFTPGRTVLRVMIGGAREDVSALTDEQLVLRARKVAAEVDGIRADPVLTHVARARLPQYETGHLARIARLKTELPGLDLLGWGYTGLGVEACLRAAAEWA